MYDDGTELHFKMQQIYSSGLARSGMTRMKNDGLFLCYTYYLVLSSLFIADLDLHLPLSLLLTKGPSVVTSLCWVKARQWCTDSGGVPCDGSWLPALFFMLCLVMEGALFQVLCWRGIYSSFISIWIWAVVTACLDVVGTRNVPARSIKCC